MLQPSLSAVKQQGFTLIELIMVIVITSIIAIGSTQFIVNSVQGLHDVSRRSALASTLTTSIAKIEAQLHNSLVDSIRIKRGASGQCVEMIPLQASAFYLQAPLSAASDQLKIISSGRQVIGMRAYIATAKPFNIYAALENTAVSPFSGVIKTQQKMPDTNISQLTLRKAHLFTGNSSQQVVSFVNKALSYCIEGDKLFRYSDYSLQKNQPLPINLPKKEPKRVLVSQGLLASSRFSFDREKLRFSLHLSAGNSQEQLSINQLVLLQL
ncbi:MAG: prepilin-type N-terminal cleavage/methylation domain-containing protein [Oceanospirillaceae bacterium]|nr:prepilin-type N-terminal cleavage/methylation domain-containing protein [Oceanospirillaceae bacterium]